MLLLIDLAKRDEFGTVGSGGDCEDETVKRLLSKNLNGATGYLIAKARLAFTKLRKTFIKTPIFQYFDSECHIRIGTNKSNYAIGGILSQLIQKI